MEAFPRGHGLGSWTTSLGTGGVSHLPVWLWPLGSLPHSVPPGLLRRSGQAGQGTKQSAGMEVTAIHRDRGYLDSGRRVQPSRRGTAPHAFLRLGNPLRLLPSGPQPASQLAEPRQRQAAPAERAGDKLATGPQILSVFCPSVTQGKIKTQTNFVFY